MWTSHVDKVKCNEESIERERLIFSTLLKGLYKARERLIISTSFAPK